MLAKDKNDPVRVKFQNESNAERKNITLVRSIDLLRRECRNSTIVVQVSLTLLPIPGTVF